MKINAKTKTETIIAKMFDAMLARKQALIDDGKHVAAEIKGILDHLDPNGKNYRPFLHAVSETRSFIDFGYFASVIGNDKMKGANDADYIQCKTVVKVLKCIQAFGFKDPRKLDGYTRAILVNTLVGNGVITAKNAFATLVRVEFDALDEQQILRERRNHTAGTGSTQVSSTREMLRILRLTDGVKGARDAQIELLPDVITNMVQYFEPLAKRAGIAPIDADVPETQPEEINA
jgi:hypothetical protein